MGSAARTVQMTVDSVASNVHDLASVLEAMRDLAGLKPFFRGVETEVPPFQVMPGLCEAMLRLPSGLVVQPVEQKLWKMLLVVGVRALAARLAGQPLRFKLKEA